MKDEALDYVDSDAQSEYYGNLLSATAVNAEVEEDELRNPPTGVQYVSVKVSGSSGDVPIEVLALVGGRGAGAAPRRSRSGAADTAGGGERSRTSSSSSPRPWRWCWAGWRDRTRPRGGAPGVRKALLALTLALAWAPSAQAQSSVEGGGSFNDAPVVKPGRYTDTLRGSETLFYAVQVKRGQKLTATATVSGSTDDHVHGAAPDLLAGARGRHARRRGQHELHLVRRQRLAATWPARPWGRPARAAPSTTSCPARTT